MWSTAEKYPELNSDRGLTGYLHDDYANAFAEFGEPIRLRLARGWLLRRPISGTPWFDAMGCYPFLSCRDWSRLAEDVEALKGSCVAVTIVTDPFGVYRPCDLNRAYWDHIIPFKKHHVIDLSQPMQSYVSSHHRRNANNALKNVRVELSPDPANFTEEWLNVYERLVQRHGLRGMLRFSKRSFQGMLKVPGIVLFRGISEAKTVCVQLWYEQGNVAYYHLGASTDAGYRKKAAFALFWTAIDYFSNRRMKWIGLGGGAGLRDSQDTGLNRFKKGWANDFRLTYLCGRILDPPIYRKIQQLRGKQGTDYFPAYRKGEF